MNSPERTAIGFRTSSLSGIAKLYQNLIEKHIHGKAPPPKKDRRRIVNQIPDWKRKQIATFCETNTQVAAAKKFGVSITTIGRIVNHE